MSLINDALRRAEAADRRRKGPVSPLTPLQPLEPRRRSRISVAALATLLGLTLVIALVFTWRGTQPTDPGRAPTRSAVPAPTPAVAGRSGEPTVGETPLPARPAASPQAPPTLPAAPPPAQYTAAQPAPAAPAAVPAAHRIVVSTNLVLRPVPATSSTNAATAAVAPAPEASPTFKLQSIIYRRDRPTAMINGQWYEVGGKVSGATVLEIQRQLVALEWQGARRELRLPSM